MPNDISHSLPEHISFYHLGEITLEPQSAELPPALPRCLDDLVALGYTLQGDVRAALVIIFESGLDAAMYAEAGNVIASQLATKLSDDQDLDVVISPPLLLDENRLQFLERGSSQLVERVYTHAYGNQKIPIRTFLFSSQSARQESTT